MQFIHCLKQLLLFLLVVSLRKSVDLRRLHQSAEEASDRRAEAPQEAGVVSKPEV